MSQTVITSAFEQLKAQQAVTGEAVVLDGFIFANVPNLDISSPIDPNEAIPPDAQIVHRGDVALTGVVNDNAVVYSVTLGTAVGDFDFNWVGLVNKTSNVLAMIVHAPVQSKVANAAGVQGNVLTRSFLMEYDGAKKQTNITTPAQTWQIDFTARLDGIDERQRLENADIYGAAAFFCDGYLVGKTGNQFFVTKGTGYVGGLRTSLADNQNITVTTKPVKVWLDVCWTGSLTSVWNAQSKITVTESLVNYVQNGVQHYVFAVASIDVNGNITDLRPKGTLNEQVASDALKKHEQSRNHPDATTSSKGFTQLSSATDSASEGLAATSKSVKIAMDNANARLAKERNGADIPNPALFVQNIGLQETVNKAAGAVQRSEVQTSQDDVTAGKLLVNGGAIAVRSISAINGGQVDDANNLPTNAVSFVYGDAKNSPNGNSGTILDVSGLGGGYNLQLFVNYQTGNILAFRSYNGDNRTWNNWNYIYNTGYKPTAVDVGALPITGGTLNGNLKVDGFSAKNINIYDVVPTGGYLINHYNPSGANRCAYGYYSGNFDVHFYNDAGTWASNPVSIHPNGDCFFGSVYDQGHRVYSPNNPQPIDLSSYATQQWVGAQGYATQSWVLQNFVQNIDLTAPSEFQFWDGRGYMRPTDGAAMYNFSMVGGSSNVGWIQIRYTRKQVNNTWYVIN
ncbi:phage tail-collar fiber domain-containing protein [Citrobacter freundii]|uniref:phage tail-collar fiber domain-containing protein n=1 Tax=Citrobacter freundii TaxID=546 RepID=UPI0028BF46F1|nr:phage tail protein [Citrobacter freundii]MDT7446326.1 phage tail protein [Citrobacter freundii]